MSLYNHRLSNKITHRSVHMNVLTLLQPIFKITGCPAAISTSRMACSHSELGQFDVSRPNSIKLVARSSLALTASGLSVPVVVGCIGLRFLWGEVEGKGLRFINSKFSERPDWEMTLLSMPKSLWRMNNRMIMMPPKRAVRGF